jgi:lipid II:glycine glycyltransferase (peptidoglycan interpeptide bridge formation enzyme)
MHNKTRYNIRLAERKGVTVRFSKDKNDLEAFLDLTKEVEGRGSFRYHPPHYYRTMLDVLGPKGLLEIGVAEGAGRTLAVNLLIKFGERVTYGHGASGMRKRELMGPHLLQWESIKRIKGQGYKAYDLFGVAANESDSDHSWAGITRFKLGFGGRRVDLVGAHDLVLDRTFYSIYNMARRMRGALR